MSLLETRDITVHDGASRLLAPVSLMLEAGVPLVILGETGSGKSLLAQAIMGTLPAGLHAGGEVELGGQVLRAADPGAFRRLWGRQISVLPQEPWLSLDPLMRAAPQVAGAHRLVRGLSAPEARAQAMADLAAIGLSEAARKYPHELSGGMAQRVAIAAARAGGAPVVIADEPTKGLDADRRDEVAALLLAALAQGGGLLVITHDLALARMIGGQMIVLREGAVVESGLTADIFAAPRAAYTRELIDADPASWPQRERSGQGETVVSARGIGLSRGGKRLIDGLDLTVRAGGTLGITGPSGCGKSSLGDVLLGLLRPDAGQIIPVPGLAPTALQKLYQDPVSAFPPRLTLGTTLADVARLHGAARHQIGDLLVRLRLDPVLLTRRPGAVSGGELQRLALLRVMLARPRFIFADEPTSRLDPITQREVIGLLADVATQDGVAVVLVSHDKALVRKTADAVCDLGGVREPEAEGALIAAAG